MPSTTVHHHSSATSAALTASLLTLYPSAHAPSPDLTNAAFRAFPTYEQRSGEEIAHKYTAAPTFTHTSSLYRSALPELAPTSGQPPKKAFIQLLTLSSRPNLTFATSSFPLATTSTNTNHNGAEATNGEPHEVNQSTGTVALQAGEQTRSFVMLLSTRLGGLWTVARGWDVVVDGRHWIVSVPVKSAASTNGASQHHGAEEDGKPSLNGVEKPVREIELVDVEIGIGDVSLRGVAGNTREGQRGAVIFGNLLPSSVGPNYKSPGDDMGESWVQKTESALNEALQTIMSATAVEGAWDAIQGKATDEEDMVHVWSRVLRSRVSGQVGMARSGSRQKS